MNQIIIISADGDNEQDMEKAVRGAMLSILAEDDNYGKAKGETTSASFMFSKLDSRGTPLDAQMAFAAMLSFLAQALKDAPVTTIIGKETPDPKPTDEQLKQAETVANDLLAKIKNLKGENK